MSKWQCLNEAERAIARDRGLEPEGLVVNRVGADYLVFLRLRTREETVVCLYERGREAAG